MPKGLRKYGRDEKLNGEQTEEANIYMSKFTRIKR